MAEGEGGGDADGAEGEVAPIEHDASGPASGFAGAVDEFDAAFDDDHDGDRAVEEDGEGDEAGGGAGDGVFGAFDDGGDHLLGADRLCGFVPRPPPGITGVGGGVGGGGVGAGDVEFVEGEFLEEESFEGGIECGAAAGGGDGGEEEEGEDEDGEEGEEGFVGESGGLAESAGVVDFVVEDFGEEAGARPPGVGDAVAFALGFLLEGVGDGGWGVVVGMRGL